MNRIFLAVIGLLFFSNSFAQILNPVKFNYSVVKKSASVYELHIKTSLDPKWHIYSVKNPEGGAQATSVKLSEGTAVGTVKEVGKLHTSFDKEFKVNQSYFENQVDFVQTVKIKPGSKKIAGTLEYMVCNDHQCLPPKEVEFKVKL
jgi:hypothetical protein